MKVYVAKTLVQDFTEGNENDSCSVEVFGSIERARFFADAEIDDYAESNELEVTERSPDLYKADDGDYYVTIEIEEKEVLD